MHLPHIELSTFENLLVFFSVSRHGMIPKNRCAVFGYHRVHLASLWYLGISQGRRFDFMSQVGGLEDDIKFE